MRGIRSAVTTALAGVVVLGWSAVPAAAAPGDWEMFRMAPVSGDTSELVFEDVVVTPGGTFAAAWARHDIPGTWEIRNHVERWDGTAWRTMSTPDHETAPTSNMLLGIAASSASDVWGAGVDFGTSPSSAYTLHYDGRAWNLASLPRPVAGSSAEALDVATVDRNESWVVGSAGSLPTRAVLWHRVGTSWTTRVLPQIAGCAVREITQLTHVTVTPTGRVYASGTCPTSRGDTAFVLQVKSLTSYDVVTVLPVASEITDLDAGPDGTVYAVGRLGRESDRRPLVMAVKGWTVARLPRPPGLGDGRIAAVAASGAGVVVGGTGGDLAGYIASWRNGAWTRHVVVGGGGPQITALDGTPGRPGAWAVGFGTSTAGASARPMTGSP